MGSTRYGDQVITIQYFDEVDSDVVNKLGQKVIQRGIYDGGYLTRVSDVSVSLSLFSCVIGDATNQVRVETFSVVTIAVSTATPYIVLRWAYAASASNWMDVLAVASGSIQTNDLIVGKCTFSGSVLIGFNYGDTSYPRSTPTVSALFLKVEPTSPASMYMRVRAGRANFGSTNYDVADQLTPLITAPTSNSRIDLVYVGTDGTVGVVTGTAAASPSAPDYAGRMVLAEVTTIAGQTTIVATDIKDVRMMVGQAPNFIFRTGDWLLSESLTTPNGFTDVSATYTDKFIRISSSTPTTTGGTNTHDHGAATGNHALTIAEMPAHTHTVPLAGRQDPGSRISEAGKAYVGRSETSDSTGGGSAHSHTIATANNIPAYVQVKVYRKS